MERHDEFRLRHMMDAAKEVEEFAAGKSRKDLDSARKLALAIIKSIEIIGEAASKVTETFRAENDSIPWNDVISMRLRWETVQTDIPDLIMAFDSIIIKEKSPLPDIFTSILIIQYYLSGATIITHSSSASGSVFLTS